MTPEQTAYEEAYDTWLEFKTPANREAVLQTYIRWIAALHPDWGIKTDPLTFLVGPDPDIAIRNILLELRSLTADALRDIDGGNFRDCCPDVINPNTLHLGKFTITWPIENLRAWIPPSSGPQK